MNPSIDEILKFDNNKYQESFGESEFGISIAEDILSQNNITGEVKRTFEGSNLVFQAGDEFYLKLIPPFHAETFISEVASADLLYKQLPFSTPDITHKGMVGEWKYLISKKVSGIQLKYKFTDFCREEKLHMASEIGHLIGSIYKAKSDLTLEEFTPWSTYLHDRLSQFKAMQIARGNNEEWCNKIESFIYEHKEKLTSMKANGIIHADLNHEHILIDQENENWKITGVIDFADSMDAPIELEFVLPILCFFKGDSECQARLWKASQIIPQFELSDYSNMMMSLALQNKFLAFHDWFCKEINEGAQTVEEVAKTVFPELKL